jgi:hypothetical protein
MVDTTQIVVFPRGVMYLKENSGLHMLKMCNDSVFLQYPARESFPEIHILDTYLMRRTKINSNSQYQSPRQSVQ